jgi:hypothetical protein
LFSSNFCLFYREKTYPKNKEKVVGVDLVTSTCAQRGLPLHEKMLLEPKLTEALYFEKFKNDILKFLLFLEKYIHVGNDV